MQGFDVGDGPLDHPTNPTDALIDLLFAQFAVGGFLQGRNHPPADVTTLRGGCVSSGRGRGRHHPPRSRSPQAHSTVSRTITSIMSLMMAREIVDWHAPTRRSPPASYVVAHADQ